MDKSNKKRSQLISIVLVFSLLLSMLPQLAFASNDEKASNEVVFKYDDGRPDQKMARDNSFTLSPLDVGHFEVVGADQSAVRWEFSKKYVTPAGEYGTWYNISYKGGKYDPLLIENINGYVEVPGSPNINFTVKNVPSGITELKPYVDGKEIKPDETVYVSGSENKKFDVKGVVGDKLVDVPLQALYYNRKSGDGFMNTITGQFQVNSGKAIFRAYLEEDYFSDNPLDIMAAINVEASDVPPTKINVRVPSVWYIDSWNGLADYYVGIQRGDSPTQWNCTFEPFNATGRQLKWEALTPEIATYMDAFDNGIIPKKAGIAKFRVSSVKYPEISQEVSVEFKYKNPLTSAKVEKPEYVIEEKESTEFKIAPTPALATEQRFNWTYSTPGIVKITDTVSQDALNVSTPKTFTHTIKALKSGIVEVTGKPYDTTGGCSEVKFRVVVTKDGISPIPPKEEAKDIAEKDSLHGSNYLKNQGLDKMGKEWNIFSVIRSENSIDQKTLDSYYADIEKYVSDDSNLSQLEAKKLATIILTLEAMGKDPAKIGGKNLFETLYNSKSLNDISSLAYTLIALDGWNTEVPESAAWTREVLIKEILKYQCDDGGFAFSTMFGSDIDITAIVLQALAPYNNDKSKNVKKAVSEALDYLKAEQSDNAGFGSFGSNNAAATAQVLTALTSLGIDPLEPSNGFVAGSNNIIKNLHTYKTSDGFGFNDNTKTQLGSTQQVTYAMASYLRMINGQSRLFDLTDKKPVHKHEFAESWTTNKTGHWNQCECGEKANFSAHIFEWVIDKAATTEEKGLKHEECTVCRFAKAPVEIPMITEGTGGTEQEKPVKPDTDQSKPDKDHNKPTVPNKDAGKTPAPTEPKTGDTTNVVGLISLLAACSIGAFVTYRKQHSNSNRSK